ncbi:MAG: HEAT repeat domain-containing protein [Candidatus Marinimicrobia bacterium]|nr:HEAT repeat domain-containing protein [Candidatus Neomarinimicrobiota bacterium]MBL7031269.1 HEAT repeat domain-containing protein [Candidatus Neomarinimicrobiota bacterium]
MPDISTKLKEQATLYTMDAMTEKERYQFESSMTADDALKRYVNELKHTLSLTTKSFDYKPSEEKLQGQRNLLRARISQLGSAKSSIPFLEKIGQLFDTVISPRQPAWAVVSYVVIAFVAGRFLSVSPNPIVTTNNGFSSADILGLIHEGALSNVQFEKSDGENIRLAVETKQNVDVTGGTNDEIIQQILYYLLLNDANPGKRLQAVSLLKTVPAHDNKKLVLISSILSETNTGVRLRALDLLSQFETDKTIRDACLKILLEDQNEAVRMGALSILANSPSADIVPALRLVSLMDQNEYIRERAVEVMADISYLAEDQALEVIQ